MGEPSAATQPSAAILLIGEELLSGKIRDENGHHLATVMRRRGVKVVEIRTVGDDVAIIGEALATLLRRSPLLFTSGGVGPTHDDVTLEAIAAATGRGLERDPKMESLLRSHYGESITEAALRMADLPQGTSLRAPRGWPILRLDLDPADSRLPFELAEAARIYILPGIPALFRAKLEALEAIEGELPSGRAWVLQTLHTEVQESDIAPILDGVVADYPDVDIGSYPRWTPDEGGRLHMEVRLTFESPDAERAAAARNAVAAQLEALEGA